MSIIRSNMRPMLVVLACAVALLAQDNETLYRQGEQALAQNDYPVAERAYEKLSKLSPGAAEVNVRLGLIYFQESKFELAIPVLRKALKLKPNLPNADVLLAMSLSEIGQYREALAGLEKGFHRSTDAALKRLCGLQLERAYTGLQQDAKAVEVALELTKLYPNDPEVLYHGGRLFGNFAYLSMRKLAEVAPDSVWRHQAAGEAYESQGSYSRAVEEYRQVIAAKPDRVGIHFRLGRVLLAHAQQGSSPAEETAEAARQFAEELQLDSTNANAAYELAEIHRKAGQLEKAKEQFEAALKYYPDFEDAHLGLGAVLIAQQQPTVALPHIQRAIALNSHNEVSYYRLSLAYKALGNAAEQEKALTEFRRLRGQQTAVSLLKNAEVTKQQVEEP